MQKTDCKGFPCVSFEYRSNVLELAKGYFRSCSRVSASGNPSISCEWFLRQWKWRKCSLCDRPPNQWKNSLQFKSWLFVSLSRDSWSSPSCDSTSSKGKSTNNINTRPSKPDNFNRICRFWWNSILTNNKYQLSSSFSRCLSELEAFAHS